MYVEDPAGVAWQEDQLGQVHHLSTTVGPAEEPGDRGRQSLSSSPLEAGSSVGRTVHKDLQPCPEPRGGETPARFDPDQDVGVG